MEHDMVKDLLIDLLFEVLPKNFHLYGDVANAGLGLKNFSRCSAFRTFQQGGIFIVPHPL
jgi:hypothetical protein